MLSFVGGCAGVAVPEAALWLLSSLSVMVDVEGDRENVFARGPKWVSFNSDTHSVVSNVTHVKTTRGCRSAADGVQLWNVARIKVNILLVSFQDMVKETRRGLSSNVGGC